MTHPTEQMRELIASMKRAVADPMFAWETGQCVTVSQVEGWVEELEALSLPEREPSFDCADCGYENGQFAPCPKHEGEYRRAANPSVQPAPGAGEALRYVVTKNGAFTELVIRHVLKPSPCGVAGHFEFQLNGGNCLLCQRERRLEKAAAEAALRSASPVGPPSLNPSTARLVDHFSKALAEKLATAEKKYGYSDNWKAKDWMDECRKKLREHIEKGDPRDVAAYCAFLWYHGESTALAGASPVAEGKP